MKHAAVVISIFCGIACFGGDGPSNGGDPYALAFVSRMRHVLFRLNTLKAHCTLPLNSKDIVALTKAVDNTTIELVDAPLTDPKQGIVTSLIVDDPTQPGRKKIRLNRPFWIEELNQGFSVDEYVLHEYLRVIGKDKEDNNYQISSLLGPDQPIGGCVWHGFQLEYSISGSDFVLPFGARGEDLNAKDEEAEASFFASYSKWTAAVDSETVKELGPGVVLFDLSFWRLPERADCIKDGTRHTVDCAEGSRNSIIAKRYGAQAVLKVAVEPKSDDHHISELAVHPVLKGEKTIFRAFPRSSTEEILAAISKARASFDAACASWKASVRERYGNAFVLADCGTPLESREAYEPIGQGRTVWFQSQGRVFVLEKGRREIQ